MNTIVKMLITLTIVGVISGGLLSQISNWNNHEHFKISASFVLPNLF